MGEAAMNNAYHICHNIQVRSNKQPWVERNKHQARAYWANFGKVSQDKQRLFLWQEIS